MKKSPFALGAALAAVWLAAASMHAQAGEPADPKAQEELGPEGPPAPEPKPGFEPPGPLPPPDFGPDAPGGWFPFGPEKQPPSRPRGRDFGPFGPEDFGPGGPPDFGPGGPPGFGPGGPGGPGRKRQVVREFDKDGDGRLNREERAEARKALQGERQGPGRRPGGGPGFGPGRFGPGGPPGFGPPGGPGEGEAPQPGARVSPDEVPHYPDRPLYDPTILRTLFFEFEDENWEAQLADFHRTDVEIPATLIVDGVKYPKVGVRVRGNTSAMVGQGLKRPLNVSIDYEDPSQRLYGYKTLNLLNGHEDPSLLRVVLYLEIARHYIPAPRANFVKVVINGENWGVYVNVQQFDKKFLSEWFPSSKGVRWKVPVAFGGGGGLSYLGEDLEAYKRFYEMKTEDGDSAWRDLARLCQTLEETPVEELEERLRPILDIDSVLWYLAIDNALVNNDGYWIRGSDYCLFRDERGRFHVIPYDVNETFTQAGGPGFGPGGPGFGPGGPGFGLGGAGFGPGDPGGPRGPGGAGGRGFGGRGPDFGPGAPGFDPGRRGSGLDLDPLSGADDPRKPLLHRLLAVPKLKDQYLRCVRAVAEEWLDWERLGPIVEGYRSLIAKEVEADTKKLYSFAAFLEEDSSADRPEERGPGMPRPGRGFGPFGGRKIGIQAFAQARRDYLLRATEKLAQAAASPNPP